MAPFDSPGSTTECLVHRLHRHAHRAERRRTRAVIGDYVSVFDIQQAVIDKATVPIYDESRIAKLSLNEAELPKIDSEFAEITEHCFGAVKQFVAVLAKRRKPSGIWKPEGLRPAATSRFGR